MPTSTLISHIEAAVALQQRSAGAYMAIGKTSAWDNEANPPEEDSNTEALTEVIGYKKVSQFSLARPLKTDETTSYPVVTYGGQQWVLIPVDKAFEEKARWVYVAAEISPDDLPFGTFRQIGVYLDLVPKSGVTKQNLLPDEVQSAGRLQFFENRELQNRTASVFVEEQFIITV